MGSASFQTKQKCQQVPIRYFLWNILIGQVKAASRSSQLKQIEQKTAPWFHSFSPWKKGSNLLKAVAHSLSFTELPELDPVLCSHGAELPEDLAGTWIAPKFEIQNLVLQPALCRPHACTKHTVQLLWHASLLLLQATHTSKSKRSNH